MVRRQLGSSPLEPPDQSPEKQEDDRSYGRDADRAKIEFARGYVAPPEKSRPQPAADERAHDPEEDRDDTTRRVPPWHQKLGQTPRHQAEEDPVKPERQTLYLRNAEAALRERGRPTAARSHPIDPEKDERADDGEDDALDREAVQRRACDHVAEKSTDERTYDADNNGNDNATGIVPRHDGLGDRARDEAKNDPCENSHLPSSKVIRQPTGWNIGAAQRCNLRTIAVPLT